ncbi:MAG: acyl-CoA dehydrogenase [Oscillibacter sp.]|nr:acyl-CoA dehydrogenase [Oscillibacter sp.]
MSKYLLMTKDQEDLVAMVHDFMEKKVDPYVAQWDKDSHCPMDEVKELMELGFWGIDVPEQYGGAGLDVETIMYIRMAMAYHDAGFANTFSAQTFGWKPVLLAGTEEQKQKWGRRLAEGAFWAMCITEPQSGSDAGNCKTKAVKDGDEYVITGGKTFITNGGLSDIYTVTCCTDPAKGNKGISLFIVERDRKGVSVGKHEDKMGIRTSNTTDVVFDEVRVPAENMIGAEGTGFKTLMKMLSRTRPTGVAPAVGVAQRALDLAIEYSRTRLSFGQPIGKLEGIQFKLADMEAKIQACQAQLAYSAKLVDQGIYDTLNGSSTKLFVSEAVLDITLQAQQVYGGYGYSKEYPLEKLVRDARIYSIYEGSSEIQRYIIGKTLVGKI